MNNKYIKKVFLSSIVFLFSCSNEQPLITEIVSQNNSINSLSKTSSSNLNLSFPQDWIGNWKGSCKMFQSQNKEETFNMNLIVQKLEGKANKWLWQIEYKSPTINQIRKYELQTVNEKNGHFIIDEKNGIVLDTFLYKNNTMLEQFTVGTSNLTVKHQLVDKNNMNIEFIIFSNDSIRKTGSGENIVNSYQLLNYQDCKLKK